jgi:NAD(P)-dependent dehydrogenase (short-subunit alcohol dehydrogenase family)
LLAEGVRVALLDIDPESLKDTTSRFAGAFAVPVDVADADSVHDAIGAIEQEFGHLDILVNNAGIVRSSNFADLPPHEWNEVFAVNSTGPFLMSQAAVPLLRKGAAARGPQGTSAIVSITSVEAHIVISRQWAPPGALQRFQGSPAAVDASLGRGVRSGPRKGQRSCTGIYRHTLHPKCSRQS